MIAGIEIDNLGAHSHTDLPIDARGTTEVSGASEAGKTQLMDAVMFCLFGQDRSGRPFDARSIRSGHNKVSVSLRIRSGSTLIRTLRISDKGVRNTTRKIVEKDGTQTTYKREDNWLGALKKLGASPDAVRVAMIPGSWQKLALGGQDGLPLRNLLADLLPKVALRQVVAQLMHEGGNAFHDSDPVGAKDAEDARKKTNKKRNEAEGDFERMKLLVMASEVDTVTEADQGAVEAARDLADTHQSWVDYDAAQDAHDLREEQRSRQALNAEEWRARAAALGERPESASKAMEDARKKESDAIAAETKARRSASTLESEAARAIDARGVARDRDLTVTPSGLEDDANSARRKLSDVMAALEHGDICPTCKRGDWKQQAEELQDQRISATADVESAENAIIAAQAKLAKDNAAEVVRLDAEVDDVKKRLNHAIDLLAAAENATTTARSAATTAAEANAPGVQWDLAESALGTQPTVIDEEPPPAKPTESRPTDDERTAAIKVLKEADEQAGRVDQRDADAGKLKHQKATSERLFKEAKAEATRLDALVAATRAAPSVAAREQEDALGDIGPVSLEWPDNGGCIVLVDGRPWDIGPSDGRLIVADAYFRGGIRHALGMPYLPIFIDQVQSVGGQPLPAVAEPVILLRTTDHDGLEVTT